MVISFAVFLLSNFLRNNRAHSESLLRPFGVCSRIWKPNEPYFFHNVIYETSTCCPAINTSIVTSIVREWKYFAVDWNGAVHNNSRFQFIHILHTPYIHYIYTVHTQYIHTVMQTWQQLDKIVALELLLRKVFFCYGGGLVVGQPDKSGAFLIYFIYLFFKRVPFSVWFIHS